jgi:hypothetical protein
VKKVKNRNRKSSKSRRSSTSLQPLKHNTQLSDVRKWNNIGMQLPIDLLPVFSVPIVWIGALWLLAQLSGWTRLSEKYRCDHAFAASCKGWQSGKIGYVGYHHCLWLAIAPDGLYLKTEPTFLFGAFHPPLRIPWSAIRSVEEHRFWWTRTFDIKLNDPDLKITVGQETLSEAQHFLGEKLKLLEHRSS